MHQAGSLRALVPFCLLAAMAAAQTLDDLRQAVRDAATSGRYAAFLAVISDLAADGELTGGHLTIDGDPELRLTTFTLPFRNDVPIDEHGNLFHFEAMFGYGSASLDFGDLWSGAAPALATSVSTRYDAFTSDFGAGFSLPIGDGLLLQPLLHGGLSYVTNDADFGGPGAAATAALTRGILFDWDAFYGSYGASLALRRPGIELGDSRLEPLVRVDVRRTEGLVTDDAAQDASDTVAWGTLRARLDTPTGWQLAGKEVHWLPEIGYRHLFGDAADDLGFDGYFELGCNFGWDPKGSLPLLSDLQFGGALLVGDDVLGWSVGLAVQF